MTKKTRKDFLVELTRLTRKYGIQLETAMHYDTDYIVLSNLPSSWKRGHYIMEADGTVWFIPDPDEESWKRDAYISGKPPEDQASAKAP